MQDWHAYCFGSAEEAEASRGAQAVDGYGPSPNVLKRLSEVQVLANLCTVVYMPCRLVVAQCTVLM